MYMLFLDLYSYSPEFFPITSSMVELPPTPQDFHTFIFKKSCTANEKKNG